MPPTARAAGTAAAPVITWARTFPAVPAQVREARRFLAGLLDGGPAAADALICLSELASNAVVHSRSSQPGGTFTVRVQLAGQRLRVEVCDQGGPWDSPGRASSGEPGGRGLLIVGQSPPAGAARDTAAPAGPSGSSWKPAAEHRHVPHG